MVTRRVRILLVESNPDISDLIARQTLKTLGYQILTTRTVSEALQEISNFFPDIIITELHLPDLSGKDLLVALNAQGIETPIIVIAAKGLEADLVSALRLGAADYIMTPIREVEIVSAVDRVNKQIQMRREKDILSQQLKQTNHELQQRVRELTTIISIGKAVTSITVQKDLLNKIVEGAIYVSSAEAGWLLLKKDQTKTYLLVAQKNLPTDIASQIGQPWDDGISKLVAVSGEPLSIHGDPIRKFKISQLGQSALVVPIKVKKEVFGLMVVMRKQPTPFTSGNAALLEAVADYASISLVNARLIHSLEERALAMQAEIQQTQTSNQQINRMISIILHKIKPSLVNSINYIDGLLQNAPLKPGEHEISVLNNTLNELRNITNEIAEIIPEPDKLEKF